MLISSGLLEATLWRRQFPLKPLSASSHQPLPPSAGGPYALEGPPPCLSAPSFQIWDPVSLRKLDWNSPVWWRLTISYPFLESPSESLINFHCTTYFNINWNKRKKKNSSTISQPPTKNTGFLSIFFLFHPNAYPVFTIQFLCFLNLWMTISHFPHLSFIIILLMAA